MKIMKYMYEKENDESLEILSCFEYVYYHVIYFLCLYLCNAYELYAVFHVMYYMMSSTFILYQLCVFCYHVVYTKRANFA